MRHTIFWDYTQVKFEPALSHSEWFGNPRACLGFSSFVFCLHGRLEVQHTFAVSSAETTSTIWHKVRAAPLFSICRISCDTPFLKTRVALLKVPRTIVVCLARGIGRCYKVEMDGSGIVWTTIVLRSSVLTLLHSFQRGGVVWKLKLNWDISMTEKDESQATLPSTPPHTHTHKRSTNLKDSASSETFSKPLQSQGRRLSSTSGRIMHSWQVGTAKANAFLPWRIRSSRLRQPQAKSSGIIKKHWATQKSSRSSFSPSKLLDVGHSGPHGLPGLDFLINGSLRRRAPGCRPKGRKGI